MSRTIQVLADAVANQIAAGEVVERPASVVKELVENALDAGAKRVEVDLIRGGRRSIRVTDDGSGMSREDALLSLDRHATSKIRTAADLAGIRTLGFRGEAIPSIAAVSRLTIITRESEEEVGTLLKVTGGTILTVEDAPRRRGTTVEVTDLFFNAPARQKFLKGAAPETRAISESLISTALSHPRVTFHLRSDDRSLLDLPGTEDLTARIQGVWGTGLSREMIPVSGERGGMRVRGLVQRPDAVTPGHRKALLYVGGRPFRDPALLRAVERAYRTTVPAGHRPWVFLYLDLPGPDVDVNVHPAKAEVRFRDLPGVEALMEGAIREALADQPSSATLDRELDVRPFRINEGGRGGAVPGGYPARGPGGAGSGSRGVGVGETGGPAAPSGSAADQMALFTRGSLDPDTGGDHDSEGGGGQVTPDPDYAVLAARSNLWQVLNTYILAETRDGLIIIDQHSAHERVLFEELMDRFDAGGQEGQRLLFPLTIRLTPGEYQQVEALQGLFSRSGFEVEGFGGDTVIVQSVPNPHPYFDAERCFREMIGELTEGSELVRSAKNQHERIAMTFACKGAIKAGQRLSQAEMSELFDRLFATELPYHDVHGRPTIVRLSAGELERKFGR